MSDIDILQQMDNIDLSKVETSFPLLASGIVQANIVDAKFVQEDSKKRQGQKTNHLFVEYTLAQPWKTSGHDGPVKTINPGDRGSKFSERIYFGTFIDEKDGGKEKPYGLDRILKLREAIYGKADESVKFSSIPPTLIGQTVTVNLKFEPAPVNSETKEVMGPRTSVAGYVKKR